ncbi:uncharacterized protein LOC126382424 [Pectinophora gossypiella]|uniref:uncharacterized protein LOC126382424 n=1 Tax=Pectinophora gossypiella TaxID=13191 RepID=UPI00214E9241|nr:uncharacterized protein LOC126382424 [Pectinophora gossypiella]
MNSKIKTCIYSDNASDLMELLNNGLDPNFEGGWPIRLAARHGSCSVVKALIQYGANPHLLGESGASTLQLAVFSTAHWDTDKWTFLLSCCDSSQLADGAAVAIIFNNISALLRILETGRCNTNIPTTLTGKTLEMLSKGYKLHYLLNTSPIQTNRNVTPNASPRRSRQHRLVPGSSTSSHHPHRNLSPSVATFFNQTVGQTGLTPPRSPITLVSSPMPAYTR